MTSALLRSIWIVGAASWAIHRAWPTVFHSDTALRPIMVQALCALLAWFLAVLLSARRAPTAPLRAADALPVATEPPPAALVAVANKEPNEALLEKTTETAYDKRRAAFDARANAWPGVVSDMEVARQVRAAAGLPAMRAKMHDWAKAQADGEAALARFLDDVTLCRFLRARDGNVDKAADMLTQHLVWRRGQGMLAREPVRCALCASDPLQHAYCCIGEDVHRRAVMYSCSARAKDTSTAGVTHMIALVEQTLDDAKALSQIVWVVDFAGFKAVHANPQLGALSAHLFQNNFPERLGAVVLLDFPLLFRIFFKAVTPFLDPVTRSKVLVLHSDKEQRAYFDAHWTPQMAEWILATRKLPAAPGSYPPGLLVDKVPRGAEHAHG